MPFRLKHGVSIFWGGQLLNNVREFAACTSTRRGPATSRSLLVATLARAWWNPPTFAHVLANVATMQVAFILPCTALYQSEEAIGVKNTCLSYLKSKRCVEAF
jgi:hypothetical protein